VRGAEQPKPRAQHRDPGPEVMVVREVLRSDSMSCVPPEGRFAGVRSRRQVGRTRDPTSFAEESACACPRAGRIRPCSWGARSQDFEPSGSTAGRAGATRRKAHHQQCGGLRCAAAHRAHDERGSGEARRRFSGGDARHPQHEGDGKRDGDGLADAIANRMRPTSRQPEARRGRRHRGAFNAGRARAPPLSRVFRARRQRGAGGRPVVERPPRR